MFQEISKTSEVVQEKKAAARFLTLFSVFGYLMKYFLVFDILLQVRNSSVLSKNSKRLNHLRLIINCTSIVNIIIISSQSNDLHGQTQQFQNPKEIKL